MATPTWTEIRDQALTAIKAIIDQNVESVTINGTIYKRHDLKKLTDLATYAQKMIDNESSTTRKPAVVAFREPG